MIIPQVTTSWTVNGPVKRSANSNRMVSNCSMYDWSIAIICATLSIGKLRCWMKTRKLDSDRLTFITNQQSKKKWPYTAISGLSSIISSSCALSGTIDRKSQNFCSVNMNPLVGVSNSSTKTSNGLIIAFDTPVIQKSSQI